MATVTANCVEAGPAPLAELISDHQADVWRYLRFMGADRIEADDLTQETFLCVVRKPLQQRSRPETAAYLRSVARNQLFAARRRQGREPQLAELELAENVWAQATGGGSLDAYLDAMRQCLQTAVTPRVREALAMRYTDNASREAIAERLEMTTSGVKTMLRRAREALRECVERKTNNE